MAGDQPEQSGPGSGSAADNDNDDDPVVTHIHIAPASRLPMVARDRVEADAGAGLVGDRYHGSRHRHVTIQAADDLAAASEVLGRPIEPADTRRNLTLSHGPIPARPGERMTIGAVELEVVRIAAPCKLLNDVIGEGASAALRRRAGTVFRILAGGTIAVGDRAILTQCDPLN